MKVLPQKKTEILRYPVLKDLCKTTAALALTTSTLVGITSCQSEPNISGDIANPTDVTVETTEDLVIDGYVQEVLPKIQYKQGTSVEIMSVAFEDDMLYVDLEDGGRLYATKCRSCDVHSLQGITTSDIEEGSELLVEYPMDMYDYYDSIDGKVYILPKDSYHYTVSEEFKRIIRFAGPCAIDYRSNKVVIVSTCYNDDEMTYSLLNGNCLILKPGAYYIANNVTLDEIEEDSEFYYIYDEEDYVFFETTEGQLIIIERTSSSYYEDGLVLDGEFIETDIDSEVIGGD